jgi:hypothetical protein
MEEILKAAFSMRSVPRCFKQDKSRIYLLVRQPPANKDVNREAEEATALKAAIRQQLGTQQT